MEETRYDRRAFMGFFGSIGLGSTLLPGVLWGKIAEGAEITVATIASAEEVAGLRFDDAEREMMIDGLKTQAARIEALHRCFRCELRSARPRLQSSASREDRAARATQAHGPQPACPTHRASEYRGPGVRSRHATFRACENGAGHIAAADADVPRPHQAVRSTAAQRHHTHGRPGT